MARKRYTAEQIIGYLRRAEVMISQGKVVDEVLREIGVTGNTYYRWRKEYGGMGQFMATRLLPAFAGLSAERSILDNIQTFEKLDKKLQGLAE